MVLKSLGTFHLVKIFRNLGLVENGKRFVCSSPWKIPGKSGKSKKVGPFSWAELSNRISCSIYTFLILYTSFDKLFPTRQHLVVSSGNQLGAVPGFTIKWNNFLPIAKSIFAPTEISGKHHLGWDLFPLVYQDLSTHHDWPVQEAIVDLPIRLKGNSKWASSSLFSPLGSRTRILALLHRHCLQGLD